MPGAKQGTGLARANRALDALIAARDGASTRRWFDAMRDDDGGE